MNETKFFPYMFHECLMHRHKDLIINFPVSNTMNKAQKRHLTYVHFNEPS